MRQGDLAWRRERPRRRSPWWRSTCRRRPGRRTRSNRRTGRSSSVKHLAQRSVLARLPVQAPGKRRRREARPAGRAARSRRRIRPPRRPRERSAWLTRRPERSDTSRSWERPPASTTTCSARVVLGQSWFAPGRLVRSQAARGCPRRQPGPKVSSTPASYCSTSPSRRVPSRIRSGRGIAVGQPHVPAAEAVGVEGGARDVGHPCGHGPRRAWRASPARAAA